MEFKCIVVLAKEIDRFDQVRSRQVATFRWLILQTELPRHLSAKDAFMFDRGRRSREFVARQMYLSPLMPMRLRALNPASASTCVWLMPIKAERANWAVKLRPRRISRI